MDGLSSINDAHHPKKRRKQIAIQMTLSSSCSSFFCRYDSKAVSCEINGIIVIREQIYRHLIQFQRCKLQTMAKSLANGIPFD